MNSDRLAAAKEMEAEAAALAARDPERAAEMFREIVAAEPDRLSALRPLARLLMRLSRFEEARRHWERISTLAPQEGEPRMALGRIHARAGRNLEALDRLGEVLRINPANAEAQRLRTRVGRKEMEDLSACLSAENAAGLKPRVAALESRLAGDPAFQRLKVYSELLLARDGGQDGAGDNPALPMAAPDDSGALAFEDPFETESVEFLSRLNAFGAATDTVALDEIERDGARIMADNPRLAKPLAQFHAGRGNTQGAIEVYRRLCAGSNTGELWLEAAQFAGSWGQTEAVIEFCERAVGASDADRSIKAQALNLLCESGAHDKAIEALRALPGYDGDLDTRRRIVRILFDLGRDAELIDETLGLLATSMPSGAMPESRLAHLVEIVRRFRRSAWRSRAVEKIASRLADARARSDGSAIANWTLGMLASAQLDFPAATTDFEAALAQAPPPQGLKIDLAGELALLHERFHRFGEAHAAMLRMSQRMPPAHEYASLARVRKVVDFCGRQPELRFPECLIDVILEEIASAPIGYEPRPKHLLTVSSSLRPGGSERQTVTVIGRMATDPRLERVVLAIRAIDEDGASFLRAAREMPIEIVHFGENWSRRSDIAVELPQLEGRDRLIGALDLLPRNLREDIVRISRLIFEGRPQAVHLRQDLFASAIACAVAGVPKFIIHRGSLSPDLWGHGPLETNLFLRPMQHTYRRLLERPNFRIVNNSAAGAQSDREWTEWPDPSPFRVVHNAVEFGKLEHEPHADLRAEAGIAHDAFLVGGIFRIEAVKRPMLWIETAFLVAAACPNAHFVVLGDGAMAQQMRDFARAHGFAGRLHMPGFVANVGEWLRVIDLNLLTSDREGLPNVLIEGQHFGVPAVSSDVGGAFETIEPGVTGHLVPVHSDASVFADAILKIVADPAWRDTARTRAPACVHARFGVERTVDELLACLDLSTSNC
ncbi:MAG TPA: glycosyltransferase [Rhizomicrobium sp.]|nr:glycosyltransferase [Rhizomicrobium sp.]